MKRKHQLGDEPIQMEFKAAMEAVAESLDHVFNGGRGGTDRTTGFVLLLFPFGDHSGRCNYISNGADRSDIVKLMKEQIAHFESQGELLGDVKDLKH